MRKFILKLYLCLITVITLAVLLVGCGDSSSSGGSTSTKDIDFGQATTDSACSANASNNSCLQWTYKLDNRGVYHCWGLSCPT